MSPESPPSKDGGIHVAKDDDLPEGLKKEHSELIMKEEIKEDKAGLLPISPCGSEENEEPQMNTPEDPVIHSPPSLRGAPVLGSPTSIAAALHNSPLNSGYGQSPTGCDGDNRGSCDSPGSPGEGGGDMDARRRQKTCRVCGDHATGYNFNVITCESCKAFFRRNALRPKEFKCPYSEDCDINSVSRRFCQKCRLRKCFNVGMKKEWILNEEQLRRRKNSRLNNMASQQRMRQSHDINVKGMNSNGGFKNLSSPVSVLTNSDMLHSPPSRHMVGGSIVSPSSIGGGSSFPLLSPTDSSNSDSPPGPRSIAQAMHNSPDGYDSALLLQQRMLAARVSGSLGSPTMIGSSASIQRPSPRVDPIRQQVVLSMEEYQNLMQMAASSSTSAVSPLNGGDQGSPEYKPNVFSPSANISSPINGSMAQYGEMSSMASAAKAELDEKLKNYLDSAISDEMAMSDSPDISSISFTNGGRKSVDELTAGEKLSYQLNTAELRALDVVRDAFNGMNETLDAGRQRESFMKANKTPADIMNIMDVTMRRLVKMAKKLPTFNELTDHGKFALLKGGMVEMLTVRGVTRFDSSSNSWITPVVPAQYSVSVNMFDQLNMANRDIQKTRFLQFVSALHEDLRKNELAISLIMLVVLFTQRDNVTNEGDRLLIAKHNRDYMSLLYRYLESLYGEDARKFQEILPRALQLLHLISENSVSLFLGTVKPDEAEPLPREFFKTD